MKKGILMLLTLISLVCVLCSCGECTDHTYGEWSVKTAATCTQAGVKERVCTNCEHVDTAAIPTVDHSFTKEEVLADDANLASAATCTAKATYYKLCAACDAVSTETFESGDVLAHSFTKEEVLADNANLASAATCTAKATYYKLCAACDAVSTETFEYGEVAAHSFTKEEVLADNANLASAATCTAKATYYKLCAACGAVSTTDTFEYGDMLAHSFTKEEVLADNANLASAATCTAKATYFKLCAACNALSTETFESGDVLAHSFTKEEVLADNANLASAATCLAKATYYKLCAACDAVSTETFESGEVAAHVYTKEAVLADNRNLVSEATCIAKAVYYKVCEVCDGFEAVDGAATFENGELAAHVYEREFIGGDLLSICNVCRDFTVIAESPSASQNSFSVDVADFNGIFIVPASKVAVSGFYFVTLEGTTKITSGYKGLYNTIGAVGILGFEGDIDEIDTMSKYLGSQNRDKADGYLYSVYLVAGIDNIISYAGNTVTKANFVLAEPYVDDSIVVVGGKANTTELTTVANAVYKNESFYQLRSGSVLQYKAKITVNAKGFFSIGAAVGPTTGEADMLGSLVFTFTDANGKTYTASTGVANILESIGNPELRNGGSEATYYAPDLTYVYLPAGEYTLTVSQNDILAVMIGAVSMTPMAHECQPSVSFDKEPTCTEDGYVGEGCPVCLDGVTYTPATGHNYGEGVTTDATCEADGSVVYTCANCGDVKTEVIPALGHAWDEGVTTDATCTVDGATVYTCLNCNGTKTDVITASHAFGEWVTNDAGTEMTRTCDKCGETESQAIVTPDAPDGKTLTPTFTTEDNKTWTITIPGEQIAFTGVYRFNLVGSGVAGKYLDVTTSSDANIFTAAKINIEGTTFTSWHETLVVAKDEDGDGKNDDVIITIVDRGGANVSFTEVTLSLIGKVVAYTTTTPTFTGYTASNGTVSAAAGTYTVGAFFNGANSWTCTVNVGDNALTDEGTNKSGTTALGNYHNGSVQHNGSTNTAGMKIMGTVTFDSDVTDLEVSTSATGQFVTGGGKKIVPVFLMILAEDLQ